MTGPNTTFYRPRGEGISDIGKACSHIFAGGRRCASPALRGEPHCYHHQTTRIHLPTRKSRAAQRRARRTFSVASPTTRPELQQTLSVIIQALAHDHITLRRAGRLLAALQQLGNNLQKLDHSHFGPSAQDVPSLSPPQPTKSITLKESEHFQQLINPSQHTEQVGAKA